MRFLDTIFSLVWDISQFFYSAYLTVSDWVWPFYKLAPKLLYIGDAFWYLLTPIAQFGDWVDSVATAILEVVTLDNVWQYFKDYFQAAQYAWSWVQDAFTHVTQWVVDWWASNSIIVQGWIAIATQGFSELVVAWSNFWTVTWPEWTGNLGELRSLWDTFWTVTLPTLVSFAWLTTWWDARLTDIQALINTAFTLREGFWAGWQEIKEQVFEFFTDPEDWLYKAVDRIIERFW